MLARGLVALSLSLCSLAFGQDDPVRLNGVVVRERDAYYLEFTPRGGAKERAQIASAPPALQALVNQTIQVDATFHAEIGGAGGGDHPVGSIRAVRLRFVDPELVAVRGRVQSTPGGAVLVEGAQQQQGQPSRPQLRLEGERSILLMAAAAEREVELEGWRFSGGRPLLVSALGASAIQGGYLSVARRAAGGEAAYEKLSDVARGQKLWVSRLALHRRGDAASPFRDLAELDLDYLDVDGNGGAEDEDKDVIMAFTRPGTSAQGDAVPSGFIPLRKLDLGAAELQRKLSGALVGIDAQAPPEAGLIQKLKPAVR